MFVCNNFEVVEYTLGKEQVVLNFNDKFVVKISNRKDLTVREAVKKGELYLKRYIRSIKKSCEDPFGILKLREDKSNNFHVINKDKDLVTILWRNPDNEEVSMTSSYEGFYNLPDVA